MRKITKRWLGLGLLSSSLLLLVLLLPHKERSLLDGATRVLTLDHWQVRSVDYDDQFYWLSNHELLWLDNQPTAKNPWQVSRFDVVKSTKTLLPSLTRLISATSDPNVQELSVSPTGASILWIANNPKLNDRYLVLTASLDGLHSTRFSEGPFDDVRWLGIENQWMTLILDTKSGGYAYGPVHDPDHPQLKERLPLAHCSAHDLTFGTIVANATLVTDTWHGVNRKKQDGLICVISLRNKTPDRSYTVHLPSGKEVQNIAYSPKGDRIAWLLAEKMSLPGANPLQRLLTLFRPRGAGQSVWVSKLDGSEMHAIGYLPPTTHMSIINPVQKLEWMPDGDHLSFVYQDALWSLSTISR